MSRTIRKGLKYAKQFRKKRILPILLEQSSCRSDGIKPPRVKGLKIIKDPYREAPDISAKKEVVDKP